MIAALGQFEFSIKNINLKSIAITTDAGFSQVDTIGGIQKLLSIKEPSTEVEIAIELIMQGSNTTKDLKALLNDKKPLPLITAAGNVIGQFILTKISESHSSLLGYGARKQDITITLVKESD